MIASRQDLRLGLFLVLLVWCVLVLGLEPAVAQPTTPAAVQPFVRNTTRVELWRYFEPPPPTPTFTPGDPSTAHIGNRLLAGLRWRRARLDTTFALQYVQFAGLPDDASGPGALGTGALYFDHSGTSYSRQVFLKTASIAVRRIAGHLDVQVGRMPYTGGPRTRRAFQRSRASNASGSTHGWSANSNGRCFSGPSTACALTGPRAASGSRHPHSNRRRGASRTRRVSR